QDHPVARRHQRIDIAVEVGPARGTGTGAVDHQDHLAFSRIVIVQSPLFSLDELAGGFVGMGLHYCFPVSVVICYRCQACRAASRSSATSTIMSSWPPTIWRLPSSTRISRALRPYLSAATSAWRRKLEYT